MSEQLNGSSLNGANKSQYTVVRNSDNSIGTIQNASTSQLQKSHHVTLPPRNNAQYDNGWRAGKPVEDPEKLKTWGFISAKPSEYLISLHRGKVNPRRSGQGATLWKWPWESIAIVPTTLQQIEFMADQVTREKVGVTVIGIAVYRIVNPELAYRVLNFSYGERASEKLARTLSEMFVGASRRLIANLSLEECLMKRKEAIASFLMQEIAPVISGKGSGDDDSDQGWGVVLDTIEIQNVYVQSAKVFEDLQAPFRAQLASQSEMAELTRQQEVAERRAEAERKIAESSLLVSRDTRALRARTETEAAELEAQELLKAEQARARVLEDELSRRDQLSRKQVQVDQEVALREADSQSVIQKRKRELEQDEALARISLEQQRELGRLKAIQERELRKIQVEQEQRIARLQAEQAQELAKVRADEAKRAAIAESELATLKSEAELRDEQHVQTTRTLEQQRERDAFAMITKVQLKERELQIEMEVRRQRAEALRIENEVAAVNVRAQAEVEQLLSTGRALNTLVSTGLPEMAKVLQGAIGPISLTHVGGGDSAVSSLAGLIAQGTTLFRALTSAPASSTPETTVNSGSPESR